jgi:hypothetical protein
MRFARRQGKQGIFIGFLPLSARVGQGRISTLQKAGKNGS